MRSQTRSNKFFNIFAYTFLIFFGIVLLYPLFYAIIGSVTTQGALDSATKSIFPKIEEFFKNISNYFEIFKAEGLAFSFIITLIRIAWRFIIIAATSVLIGFIFARMRFPFKNLIFMVLMSSMMIPGVAMTVPNYIFMSKLTLIDNPAIYFVMGLIDVYNIFLVRQSIASLGGEMEEAAEIDGAGLFRIVYLIYMPLLKPVLAVIFINLFSGVWADYTTSFIFMSNLPEWQTIGFKVTEIMEYYTGASVREYPKMYAVSIVSILPPIIAFLCVQESFIEGLALGGVKG